MANLVNRSSLLTYICPRHLPPTPHPEETADSRLCHLVWLGAYLAWVISLLKSHVPPGNEGGGMSMSTWCESFSKLIVSLNICRQQRKSVSRKELSHIFASESYIFCTVQCTLGGLGIIAKEKVSL